MKIIAVFKTHFDIGYTRLASEVLQQYSGKMLDDVIDACEQTYELSKGRRYVWTMASWPLIKMLRTTTPEKRAKAEALIRRGQLVPHGLPFTTHTEFLTKDEINYGCLLAKRLCREYGIPSPVSAKMTDVPGHTAGLIEPMVKNGIRFLHLGCNPASMPPKVPTLFWWEDKDGNRVLTMYNSDYGSELLPPDDWKFPVWLAMLQTYDNVGPQGAQIISSIEKQAEGKAELTVGTMDDFYNEIIKCDLSGLPVIRGELGDTWIHGVATYPQEVSALRRARAKLKKMIKDGLDVNDAAVACELETFYDAIILFGEHTWGLDVRSYIGDNRRFDKAGFTAQLKEDRFKLIEKSWNEKRAVAYRAVDAVERLAKNTAFVKPEKTAERNGYSARMRGDEIVVTAPDGTEIVPSYDYRLISFWDMSEFERHYLQRMCHWGLSDFGRDGHPETKGRIYGHRLVSVNCDGGSLVAEYACCEESYKEYGNAVSFTVSVTCFDSHARVSLRLKGKQATPRLEAGNMFFDIGTSGSSYIVTKSGQEVDPCRDIVPNANNVLFCAESYAAIDETAVSSIDAPLVSFGGNGIFEKTLLPFKKSERKCIVFNLFNNQWGTNFPLYNSGDYLYEFEIMPLKRARRELPLSKCDDLPKSIK